MDIRNNIILIFDLDDTLYKEIDYLKSAYKEISLVISNKINRSKDAIFNEMIESYFNGLNVFETILDKYQIKDIMIKDLIFMYRNHKPKIYLNENTNKVLLELKKKVFKTGLITDGRSMQQRNKISALGLSDYFDEIIISDEFGSEKPDIKNFKYFINKYGEDKNYLYVGDNVKKDFITPNKMGWNTICLIDNGNNIHKQDFNIEIILRPKFVIKDLIEIKKVLKKII